MAIELTVLGIACLPRLPMPSAFLLSLISSASHDSQGDWVQKAAALLDARHFTSLGFQCLLHAAARFAWCAAHG